MAKTLSKTGINNSSTIQAWHVSQSVDALTGASDYDITISGSLVITASANQFTPVLTARGQINTFNISSSGNISSSTIFVSNDITSSAFRALNNATIGGTLGVTGTTTLNNATIGGILGVTGATTLSNTIIGGTLSVTGVTTLSILNVNNDIRLAGTLQATGSQGNFNQLFVSNSSGNPYPRLGWNNGAEWDFLENVGGLSQGAAWFLSYPQLTEANLISYQTSSNGNTWGDGVITEGIKSMFYGENIKVGGIALSPVQGDSTQWARFEFDTGYVSFDQFWLRGSTQASSLYIKAEKKNNQNEYTTLWETTRSAGWPGHIVKQSPNFTSNSPGMGRIRVTFRNISGSANTDNEKTVYINCFNYLGSYSGNNGPSFFRIYDYNSTQANIKRPLSVTPANTNNLVTSLFTIGPSDNNFKAGFANGSGNGINTEQAKIGMWYTSTVNSTATPVTHIGFLRGNSDNGSGMTFNVNNTEMMRISSTGAITASGAISSSAGLFSTTLTTTGAITASIISASSGITASSMLANNYRRATANLTTVGNVTIDASLTGSVTWFANLVSGTYNLSASMPQDGLSLDVYIQNTNSIGAPLIALCGSTDGTTYFSVSGSNGGTTKRFNFTANVGGSAFVQFRRVGNTIIAGIC